MSPGSEERLRELLERSELEREALKRSLDGLLEFQKLAEAVGASEDPSGIVEALVAAIGRVVPWLVATVRLEAEGGARKEVFHRGTVPASEEEFRELEESALIVGSGASAVRPTCATAPLAASPASSITFWLVSTVSPTTGLG